MLLDLCLFLCLSLLFVGFIYSYIKFVDVKKKIQICLIIIEALYFPELILFCMIVNQYHLF